MRSLIWRCERIEFGEIDGGHGGAEDSERSGGERKGSEVETAELSDEAERVKGSLAAHVCEWSRRLRED